MKTLSSYYINRQTLKRFIVKTFKTTIMKQEPLSVTKTQKAIEEMRKGETITCDSMDDYLKLVQNEL